MSCAKMDKIVVTGPECSGKTTLATALSRSIGGIYVPEFARTYLSMLNRSYVLNDIRSMYEGQMMLEEAASGLEERPMISDTSTLVLLIWSQLRFGQVDPVIEKSFLERSYDLHLLCAPEPTWEPDVLRENPTDRWSLFYLYHKQLIASGHAFRVLHGPPEARLQKVLDVLL